MPGFARPSVVSAGIVSPKMYRRERAGTRGDHEQRAAMDGDSQRLAASASIVELALDGPLGDFPHRTQMGEILFGSQQRAAVARHFE